MSQAAKKEKKVKRVQRKAEGALKEAEKEVKKAGRAVEHEAKTVERAVRRKGTQKHDLVRPPGRTPEATVFSRNGTEMVSRQGRGFSLGELAGAGFSTKLATGWGARVDPRRRSVLEGNVSALRTWHSHASGTGSVRRDAEAVKEKIEEAAGEIVKGVEELEKEAAKVEGAAKREARKAEGALKAKAERKPRPKKKERA